MNESLSASFSTFENELISRNSKGILRHDKYKINRGSVSYAYSKKKSKSKNNFQRVQINGIAPEYILIHLHAVKLSRIESN